VLLVHFNLFRSYQQQQQKKVAIKKFQMLKRKHTHTHTHMEKIQALKPRFRENTIVQIYEKNKNVNKSDVAIDVNKTLCN